jgi:hemoglobin
MKRNISSFLIALGLSLAQSLAAAQNSPADDSLYKAFGEKAGLSSLMEDFVQRLVQDKRIGSFFKDTNSTHLAQQLTEQLCMLSGGPCTYRGAPMKDAHLEMGITKSDFNALVEVLQVSMQAKGIAFPAQNRMLAKLAPMHREIVTPR